MARPKKETTGENISSPPSSYDPKEIVKDLKKDFSSLEILSESDSAEIPWWLPSGSIGIDWTIGQGIPGGRLIEIYSSNPSEGKSTILTTIVREAQKAGAAVLWLDSENGTLTERMIKLGVDPNLPFEPVDEMEQGFALIASFVEKVRKKHPTIPILIAWDSIGACPTKAEQESEWDANTVGLQARVLSKSLKRLVGTVLQAQKATLVCTNQTREKIGVQGYGETKTSVGGLGFKFYAHVRIGLSRLSNIKDSEGNIIGIEVVVKNKKNKVARPFRETTIKVMSDFGIDSLDSEFEFALQNGLIEEANKGWYTFKNDDPNSTSAIFRRKDYAERKPESFNAALKEALLKTSGFINTIEEELVEA